MPNYKSRTIYKSSNHNRRRNVSGPKRRGEYIDPTRFVRRATGVTEDVYVAKHTFADFNVHQLLKTNIIHKGYEVPTPVQDQTIPLGLEGRDVIGIANTGTGKTAAFAIPILNKLINNPHSKALIIAPTRELAQQIEQECRWMAKGSGLFGALLIGGTSMGRQLADLKSRPRIVIGTPGRIQDHLERRTLNLSTFDTVVLDEVDRMLDMGFVDSVTKILSNLIAKRQSFFFSATLDHKINNLIQNFTSDPVTVSIKTGETTDMVNQDIVRCLSPLDKMDKLHDLLLKGEVEKAIVFDETQRGVEKLSNELISRGFKADSIHGGKNQSQRQRALKRFKDSEVSVLVATDVAARGIDIVDITHVINFSQPQTYQDYIHRVGRAGRAGRVGHALTFVV